MSLCDRWNAHNKGKKKKKGVGCQKVYKQGKDAIKVRPNKVLSQHVFHTTISCKSFSLGESLCTNQNMPEFENKSSERSVQRCVKKMKEWGLVCLSSHLYSPTLFVYYICTIQQPADFLRQCLHTVVFSFTEPLLQATVSWHVGNINTTSVKSHQVSTICPVLILQHLIYWHWIAHGGDN